MKMKEETEIVLFRVHCDLEHRIVTFQKIKTDCGQYTQKRQMHHGLRICILHTYTLIARQIKLLKIGITTIDRSDLSASNIRYRDPASETIIMLSIFTHRPRVDLSADILHVIFAKLTNESLWTTDHEDEEEKKACSGIISIS